MPVTVSYPGVYVEEIPSGVRTITGVATSITAFIGRASRGPTDEAVTINSYGDFERTFGGLWKDSTLGYAVRDFYLNGGSQAIIVRLYHPPFATATEAATAATAATAAAQAVVDAASAANVTGATKDTVAAAARTRADELKTGTLAQKTAADEVAKAAEAAASGAAGVANAATNAKDGAITSATAAAQAQDTSDAATAAQAVADAAKAANVAGATKDTVAAAARTRADEFKTGPLAKKTAADAVAQAAADAAAGARATPASVANAATSAHDTAVATATAATQAQDTADATVAAKAVADAANAANVTGATKDAVAAAARTKADEFKTGPLAQKTAANAVAQATADAAAGALATPANVAQAATDAKGTAIAIATPATQAKATEDAKAAAKAVADAANAANVTGATKDVVVRAARRRADEFKSGTPASRTAANEVANAASVAAAAADASPTSVAQAASGAQDFAIATAVAAAKATLNVKKLKLEAASEGAWGNSLRARIDHDVVGDGAADLFNLVVRDGDKGPVEIFRNVSVVVGHPRQVDKVLANESSLVRVQDGGLPGTKPDAHLAAEADTTVSPPNASDGSFLEVTDFTGPGKEGNKQGLFSLEQADLFNLLCIPADKRDDSTKVTVYQAALAYCLKRRALLIVDPPVEWKSTNDITKDKSKALTDLGLSGEQARNAALFFPRVQEFDPLRDNRLEEFVPCGAVAGIFARTDTQRGVWKAPAGLDATLVGVAQLSVNLTDGENGELNPLGVNCLRSFPAAGRVVWGSRTLQGDDRLASEWKYVPVRRLALYLEESLYRGTQWVVFEPNDEPLWAQIRLNIGAFMQNLFRQGAFQGQTPRDAYFVKCDKETTTQNDINLGRVNIVVGFAPLKPAEFVILQIQQIAGQIVT